MDTTEPTLLILEGVFHDPGTGLTVYPDGGDPQNVDEALASFEGQNVDLSLHHFPPSPPDPTIPGGGACLWGALCPCGHVADPAWLFNLNAKGVLDRLSSGRWRVSEDRIPLEENMVGHRGRLILFREREVPADQGVEDLLSEAEGLLSLLEGLRGELK